MKMLFTENWFIKAVSASPAKWQRAEKIPLLILSSWCFVRLSSSWASAHNFFLFLLLRSRGVLWPDRRAGIFEFDKRLLKEVSAKCQNVFGFLSTRFVLLKLLYYFFGVTLLQDSTYIVQVPLPVFCARFPSNVGLPPRRESPTSRDRVWFAESRYGYDSVESRLLRQGAQNFIFKFRARGWKVFWRRA